MDLAYKNGLPSINPSAGRAISGSSPTQSRLIPFSPAPFVLITLIESIQRYLLDYKKEDSNYYKAFHISYPSLADMQRARKLGVDPGGQILLHGQRKGSVMSDETLQRSNWTNGCIALINADMDEVWASVAPGTPIEIHP